MKKDKNFKEEFEIEGVNKEKYNEEYYNPDLYFKNENEVVFV